MSEIIVFAGTTEGRLLIEQLDRKNKSCIALVATEYGEGLVNLSDNIKVLTGRKDSTDIERIIEENNSQIVIDATHPFAVLVSDNIKLACKNKQIKYIRLLREKSTYYNEDLIIEVSNVEEAVQYLDDTSGNIFITTGSKELYKYTKLKNYKERITARVLSVKESVDIAAELGFLGANLICMQGPFSEGLNYEMLKAVNAKYLVTKESGKNGGFLDKLNAAKRAGVISIIIKRPEEKEGIYLEELTEMLDKL